jgi:peptide chain release factor
MLFRRIIKTNSINYLIRVAYFSSINKKIDFSKVPKLDEKDLQEDFVRGNGPGGQAIQKTNNCVVLKHLPTNIVVKHHGTRSLMRNREEARKILIDKLDELINKENSVENQRKVLEKEKSLKNQAKAEKLRKLKLDYKKSLEKSE